MSKTWCFLLLFCFSVPTFFSHASANYRVLLDVDNANISVTACFKDNPPLYINAGRRNSHKYLLNNKINNAYLSGNNRRLYLNNGHKCVAYQVDLEKARGERQARKQDKSWLVNNRSWFWRPSDNRPVQLEFFNENGEQIEVSVPWIKSDRGYLAGNTPLGWTSRMAFGDIKVSSVAVANQTIHVSLSGNIVAKKQQELLDWVAEAADSVAQVYGDFPVEHAQVLVVPIGAQKEAVPWAEVQRAGKPSVHLFVDPNRPISEFRKDWTAVHELSHLLLPRIRYNDRWLSEGIASYYQNVARARSGMLSPEKAWERLRFGFTKGRKAQSGALRNSRSTKHVYWGGAAIYLLADVRLRDLSEPQTLDSVLAKLHACCMPSEEMWSAERLMTKLDSLSQTTIFTQLLKNEANEKRFPVSVSQETAANSLINKHWQGVFKTNLHLAKTND